MNSKVAVILILLTCGAGLAGWRYFRTAGPRTGVAVTLRLAAEPSPQTDFVMAQINSARFKYESGHKAGVKPFFAQQLTVRKIPNSSLLEARVKVETKEEGQRYTESFVEILQIQCGDTAKVRLVDRTIK